MLISSFCLLWPLGSCCLRFVSPTFRWLYRISRDSICPTKSSGSNCVITDKPHFAFMEKGLVIDHSSRRSIFLRSPPLRSALNCRFLNRLRQHRRLRRELSVAHAHKITQPHALRPVTTSESHQVATSPTSATDRTAAIVLNVTAMFPYPIENTRRHAARLSHDPDQAAPSENSPLRIFVPSGQPADSM